MVFDLRTETMQLINKAQFDRADRHFLFAADQLYGLAFRASPDPAASLDLTFLVRQSRRATSTVLGRLGCQEGETGCPSGR